MGKKNATIFYVIIFLVAAIGLGMSCALQRNTLVEWWKPAALCLVPGCLVGVALGRVFVLKSPSGSQPANYLAGVAVAFSLTLGGFYSLNFYKSRPDTAAVVEAVVAKKYTEERTRGGGGRRHHGTREKYTAYCVRIEVDGGWKKDFDVKAGEYVKIRTGRKFNLDVEEGLFGFPVIKDMKLPLNKSKK